MGPHFFKCGKSRPSAPAAKIRCGFNGAALFQVRKATENQFQAGDAFPASMGPHFFKCGKSRQEGGDEREIHASMGPHFFKCGKAAKEREETGTQNELQWGRTFSSAERA